MLVFVSFAIGVAATAAYVHSLWPTLALPLMVIYITFFDGEVKETPNDNSGFYDEKENNQC